MMAFSGDSTGWLGGVDWPSLGLSLPAGATLVRLAVALVVAFGLGTLGTYITRAVARRIGFVARPRAERWHDKPTALAGGVGIFIAFAITCAWVGGELRASLLIGAAAMFVLGLVDDVVQLRPSIKLGVQLLVAVLTALAGPALPWTPFPLVNQAITVFWLVGITNALNLLDNMDGLSGGVACISALMQGLFFLTQGQPTEAAVCCALAGSLGGFLLFNFHPASIFMGDAGSLFLGYTLASLALHQSYGRSRGLIAVIAGPVLVLLIPIFDTTFVTITRMLRGQPISQGGRDHTSHRLVLLGLSEPAAVLTLWALALLSGLGAFLVRLSLPHAMYIGVPLLVVALGVVGVHLARGDQVGNNGRARALVSLGALGYQMRLFEALLDVLLAMVALLGAFMLRFDGVIPEPIEKKLLNVFPALVGCKIAGLYLSGAYDGLWVHAGQREMLRLVRGAVLGGGTGIALLSFFAGFESISRGALLVDVLLFTALALGVRASFRVLRVSLGGKAPSPRRKVLLWGAGAAGELIAQQMANDAEMQPVGFLDDNSFKKGCTIHGLPVLGGSDEAASLLRDGFADEVLVTSNTIVDAQVRDLVQVVGEGKVRRLRISFETVSAVG